MIHDTNPHSLGQIVVIFQNVAQKKTRANYLKNTDNWFNFQFLAMKKIGNTGTLDITVVYSSPSPLWGAVLSWRGYGLGH